jgi:hypothetical protein
MKALLALALITSPAYADPLEDAQKAAEVAMVTCLYRSVPAVDDHVSDAAVVAKGVVGLCSKQIEDWKYASYAEYHPSYPFRFYSGLDKGALDEATEAVLRTRVASKKAPR